MTRRTRSQPDDASLADIWRAEAAFARRIGAEAQAVTLEKCAADLEERTREAGESLVTLQEAADLTGYSYSALEKMTRAGKLENVGAKHRPRVRKADLPRKAIGRGLLRGLPDIAGQILSGVSARPRKPRGSSG